MKLAVFLGDLRETDVGGFTFQDEVLRALIEWAPHSRHSLVACGKASPRLVASLAKAGIEYLPFSTFLSNRTRRFFATAFEDLWLLLRACGRRSRFDRELRRNGIHMVWFVTPFYETTDLPYIYTVWDLQHRIQPWFPEVSANGRWLFRERMMRQMIQRAYATIAPNQAGVDEVRRYYGVSAERVVALAHPTPEFALRPPASADAPRICDSHYVFYPAQFVAHKNHVAVLRAIRRLQDLHGRELSVVFVGPDGGNLAHVRAQAQKLGIADRVHFPGFVSRERLAQLYREAFALVYPSFFGPENLPPLEAMALGTPVLASRVDGATEQFGDAARLFDPLDYDQIANLLDELLRDPGAREALVRRGLERAAAWTTRDYVVGAMKIVDSFERIRDCWPESSGASGR